MWRFRVRKWRFRVRKRRFRVRKRRFRVRKRRFRVRKRRFRVRKRRFRVRKQHFEGGARRRRGALREDAPGCLVAFADRAHARRGGPGATATPRPAVGERRRARRRRRSRPERAARKSRRCSVSSRAAPTTLAELELRRPSRAPRCGSIGPARRKRRVRSRGGAGAPPSITSASVRFDRSGTPQAPRSLPRRSWSSAVHHARLGAVRSVRHAATQRVRSRGRRGGSLEL
jgi:hypothetical protein